MQNRNCVREESLLRRLSESVKKLRRDEAEVVSDIGEVEALRAYRRAAAPSMFAYCTEVLHFSEPEAVLRIRVARAARRHPMLLAMLRKGQLHLSGIALLAPLLTEHNREALLRRVVHKSKRQIEEIVAEMQPRPDAPTTVRRLPVRPLPATAVAPNLLCPDTVEEPPALCPDTVAAPDPDSGKARRPRADRTGRRARCRAARR